MSVNRKSVDPACFTEEEVRQVEQGVQPEGLGDMLHIASYNIQLLCMAFDVGIPLRTYMAL